jgi:hypothetical protein
MNDHTIISIHPLRLRETKSIVVITHSEAFVKVADEVYRLDKGSASQVE